MKYIVINQHRFYPIPPEVSHASFFKSVAAPGAGFIFLQSDGEPICYGRSESLGVDAQPARDTLLAEIAFSAARRRVAC